MSITNVTIGWRWKPSQCSSRSAQSRHMGCLCSCYVYAIISIDYGMIQRLHTILHYFMVRQDRAELAKYVFRSNSTPPPRGAEWISHTCLGEPTGQWGASWKEYVTIWTCIQQSRGALKCRLRFSLTQPVCGSSIIPFWNRCTRYVHRFVQCSVSLLWCTRSSRLHGNNLCQ